MARKPPSIPHVKHVRRGEKWYSYFNTGQKAGGKPIYRPLPPFDSLGFWDSYAGFKAGRTKRAIKAWTVAALIDEYEASSRFADLAGNTRSLYRSQFSKIKAAWGKFPVDDLEPHHVRAVLDKEGWGAGTRNMVTAVLGTAYTWARKRNKARSWPTKDIERAKGGTHDPWPTDVVEAGLKAEDDMVRLAVHLLLFTGQRIGDVMKMRWGDIRDGYIYVRQTKTGKEVEPPLMSELVAELDKLERDFGTIIKGVNEGQLRRKLQAWTRARGVETVPHGLRKNAVNVLLEAGSSVPEVAAITGQTNAIVEHYAAKVNRRKLGQSAVVKLEAHRNKSA